jgi:hypothetical protein
VVWAGVIGVLVVASACSSSSPRATTSTSTVRPPFNKNAVPNPCRYLPLQDAESILGVEVAAAPVVRSPTNDVCEYGTDYVKSELSSNCPIGPPSTDPNAPSPPLPTECLTGRPPTSPPQGLFFQLDFARSKRAPTNPGIGKTDGARWQRVSIHPESRRVRAWWTSIPLPALPEKGRAYGLAVWTPGYLLWVNSNGTKNPRATATKTAALVLRNLPTTP